MAKVALLIGVSEYELGLNPLPAAAKDVEAMQQVLQHPEMGDFAEVRTLPNPDPLAMQEAIETLFSGRTKDDLVLLFFSGHGVKDDSGRLYFATRITRKNPRGELFKSTAVPASFVHDIMSSSRSRRQVVILDCCFSGAFAEGLSAKDDGSVDVKNQLGGEGRVVLTSSTATQYSFEQQGSDLSIYTRFIVEGIKTGAADRDEDGAISIDELHEYAKEKVQEAAPAMKPEIYAVKEGFKILLSKASTDDPKVKYRKEVENYAREGNGEISFIDRSILDELRNSLNLLPEEAAAIEVGVLKPYRELQEKLQRYEQVFCVAIQQEYPLKEKSRNRLKRLQQILGLRNEDVAPIEARITSQIKSSSISQVEPSNLGTANKAITKVESNPTTKPAPEKPSTEDIVPHARGVDYTRLRDLLAAGKWREADEETFAVMLKVSGREQEGFLDTEDTENFPSQDLQTIDQLWVKHSNGRFGFSIQKNIWQSVGGKRGSGVETFRRFGDRVGWRVNGSWLNYKNLTFNPDAPSGHLPWSGVGDMHRSGKRWRLGYILSRME